MRLLVIGGTQFFGRALVEAALARGDAVTVLSRGQKRPPFWDRISHLAVDRRDHRALANALRGVSADAVIDNVAFTEADVRAALEGLEGRAGHYILTSTGSVYHDFTPPAILRPLPEEAADLAARGDLPYAEGKRAAEQLLQAERAVPFTIIRPPIVQGPHDASLRGWFWYQRVADGGPVLVPARYPQPAWRQAFSRDLAAAFLLAAGNPAAFGKTYNVASEEILTLEDFVRLTARIAGVPDPVVPVAQERLTEEAPWYEPPYAHRFVMDISRIQRDLGFRPTPYAEWLEETIRWHMSAGLPAAAGYARREDEVALAARLSPAAT